MHALQAHDEGSGDRLIVMRRKGRRIGRVRQMGDVRRAGACFLALSLQMTTCAQMYNTAETSAFDECSKL